MCTFIRLTNVLGLLFLYFVLLRKTEYIVIVQDGGLGIKGDTWGCKIPSNFRKNCYT